ncbi:putative protein kinase [Helianthus annuus]|uniref:Protein kinase domain-containing protein n=1 Tax=Helianthus annuus TaxID=4232 RepID=A0A9K3I4G6_HELAN|nr:putative protein kinase [Helianthus annuus]KAJ0891880.1 putative protein kinase [Helianthus annuus]
MSTLETETYVNIYMDQVADFGITRLNIVGSRSRLVGTFGYMPPELIFFF